MKYCFGMYKRLDKVEFILYKNGGLNNCYF